MTSHLFCLKIDHCLCSSGSPISSDASSTTSPIKGPRPTILFNNAEEEEVTEKTKKIADPDDVFDDGLRGKESSPRIDEKYFKATVTPASCSDLINFDSPLKS